MASRSSRSRLCMPGRESQQHADAPMWVVPVVYVLEMKGIFKPHQVLKAEGVLAEWISTMFTLFVSHQWLAHHHPDPDGVQLQVLQGFVNGLIRKKLRIDTDFISQFNGRGLTKAELSQIGEAFIWFDYFSVPQILGAGVSQATEEQLLYIYNIPNYVDMCNLFVALVPKAMHHDTRSECSFNSFLERGWCRTELWSHFLSMRPKKMPILVVKSHESAQFTTSLWYRYPVHSGSFAVEEDRACCRQVIRSALTRHVFELSQSKNKTAFRLYLALFEEVTGLLAKCRTVEGFLRDFSFKKPLKQQGLGPVACAVLSGDHRLVRSLATIKASIQTKAPAMPEVLYMADLSPLHLALWFRSHDLQMLETLLELRADLQRSSVNVAPPLNLCRTEAAVELLVQYRAGVNFQGKDLAQSCPIQSMAALGAPCEVLGKLLELRADVHGGKGGLASASPLHHIAYSGDSGNDLRSAQLLLRSRADINQVLRPEGIVRSIELMSRLYSWCCRREANLLVSVASNISTTPLGWCAIFDNEGTLAFLLRARADPEIANNRGLRPIDFARSERIRRILQDPTLHICLLEHNSDQVSWSF